MQADQTTHMDERTEAGHKEPLKEDECVLVHGVREEGILGGEGGEATGFSSLRLSGV